MAWLAGKNSITVTVMTRNNLNARFKEAVSNLG
jgi:hypothetical protein